MLTAVYLRSKNCLSNHITKLFCVLFNVILHQDYIKSSISVADGECERDVVHRINKRYRAWGALKSVSENKIKINAIS